MSNGPSNPIADLAEIIAKKARDELLVKFLLKKAVEKIPFLALPIINPIFAFILPIFIDVFYDEGVLLMFFGITSVQTWKDKKEYKEAFINLEKQLTKPNMELSDEDIRKASEEFDKKLANLINFNRP